jgi:LysR family transcriptional regulator for metE and metH
LRPVEALLEGKIDLGVVYTEERDERLSYLPLFRDEVVLVMRPDHRLARKSWVTPADLVDEHLIVYNAPLSESHALQRFLGPAAVWPKRFSAIQLTEGVIELVKAGAGVSPLAQWAVAPHLGGESLVARRLGRGGLHRQWSAAMVRQDPPPKSLIEFAKMMAEGPLACATRPPRPRGKGG